MNRFSKAASAGGLFYLPRPGERVLATCWLFAFNIFRFGEILGGQFSQRYLRLVITDIRRVPLTFGSLISQIDGAWGHWRFSNKAARLPQGTMLPMVKTDHQADWKKGPSEGVVAYLELCEWRNFNVEWRNFNLDIGIWTVLNLAIPWLGSHHEPQKTIHWRAVARGGWNLEAWSRAASSRQRTRGIVAQGTPAGNRFARQWVAIVAGLSPA
jgi:hypothetical protein